MLARGLEQAGILVHEERATRLRKIGYVCTMCIELGTPIPSAPSVVRTRTRKFRRLRSSSIEAILTGLCKESSRRTGCGCDLIQP